MSRRDDEAGFSLVETLVALAIIAGMTGMLFGTISANAGIARGLERRREATMLARSLLAQATVTPASPELAENGVAKALSWRITRRSAGEALEEVRIDVMDRAAGRLLVSVRTLRLGR